MENQDFTIRILVKGGEHAGLRIVEKFGWIGTALLFSRGSFPDIKGREELRQSGVYFLADGFSGGDLPEIYIGEGELVINRLNIHYRSKDFWNEAIVFTSKGDELNKAQVKYLEARLVEIAHRVRRCKLLNGNEPRIARLTEGDRAEVEGFLAELLSMLPTLGVRAFTEPKQAQSAQRPLTLSGRDYSSTGWESDNGFVVARGSKARKRMTRTFPERARSLRDELVAQGIVTDTGEHLVFEQDFEFGSPSYAATMVRGMQSNGRTAWKDSAGRTLQEIQSDQTEGNTD